MKLAYFDTSALAKLVVAEAETEALREWLSSGSQREVDVVTSRLTDVELMRAAQRHGTAAASTAEQLLEGVERITMTANILTQASRLPPATLRTLDAIHLATAQALGSTLLTVVTYDVQMQAAAEVLGLPQVAPA